MKAAAFASFVLPRSKCERGEAVSAYYNYKKSRPNHVKCVQSTHADDLRKSLCGELIEEWAFMDLDHWFAHRREGGRFVLCAPCYVQLVRAWSTEAALQEFPRQQSMLEVELDHLAPTLAKTLGLGDLRLQIYRALERPAIDALHALLRKMQQVIDESVGLPQELAQAPFVGEGIDANELARLAEFTTVAERAAEKLAASYARWETSKAYEFDVFLQEAGYKTQHMSVESTKPYQWATKLVRKYQALLTSQAPEPSTRSDEQPT